VLSGKSPEVRDERRDYLHVDDAVTALERLLDYDSCEKVFNVGSGYLVSMTEVVKLIGEICGTCVEMHFKNSRKNVAANYTLANRELEWRPTRGPKEGLEETIASLRRVC
jgi:UDP-glucose 4-epimerase